MNSFIALSINIPFILSTVLMTLFMLIRTNRNSKDNLFIALCFLQLAWFAAELLRLFVYIPSLEKVIHSLFLIPVAFMPPITMMMSLAFHKRGIGRFKKPLYIASFFFPVITVFMVLTAQLHPFILKSFTMVEFLPIQDVSLEWGFWFWVHMFSSYIILTGAFLSILVQYFSMPKVYRSPFVMMMLAIFVTLIASVFKGLQFFPVSVDPTIIGSSISVLFFFVSVISNNQILFIGMSREAIFQFINDHLIILDANGHVADSNAVAQNWFAAQNIKLDGENFTEVLNKLVSQGAITKKVDSEGSDEGIDICIPAKPVNKVLNMRSQDITDKQNRFIGRVIILYDVTNNRLLQERLEARAGIDALTGLPNRTAYEGAKNRLSKPEFLPLTIVMCDVNGLKEANDSHGHDFGDRYLQTTAAVLEENCPPNSFLARIGGDEFIFLLPKSPLVNGTQLITKIQQAFFDVNSGVYPITVAMGAACVETPADSYAKAFAKADQQMYENKKLTKMPTSEPVLEPSHF